MSELTQAEYAAARGVSAAYVTKLKRQGRLVIAASGKVNVEATDRLIDATRDPARGGDRRPKDVPGDSSGGDPAGAGARKRQAVAVVGSYDDAARRERMAKAQIAELELAELSGQLIRRDQVERVIFALARKAQDALLSLSERVSGAVAAESDAFRCAEIIDAEARKIASTMATIDVTGDDDDDSEETA